MMAKITVTEAEILSKLPDIIVWMKALGLNSGTSRYTRYNDRINLFFKKGRDLLASESVIAFQELSLAYRECVDIAFVYDMLKDTRHRNFVAKLEKVIKGQDVPHLENAGESRDYLFELLISARLKRAGYTIDFSQTSDVAAERNGLHIRAECKRLASEKQLEKRMKKAATQLESVRSTTERSEVGAIFIDISSCVSPETAEIVTTPDDAIKEITRSVYGFVARNSSLIESLNTRFLGLSSATCLMATLPIWTPDMTLHTSTAIAVRAATDIGDERFEVLESAFAGFDGAQA